MIKQLKKLTVQLVSGANIATILIMLLAGFSDHFDPICHPNLALLGLAFPVFVLINLGFLVFWLIFKPRRAIIPILGFVCGYSPIRRYLPLNVGREIPENAIKVITYNVNHIAYDRFKTADNPILQYLVKQKADILCMQESGYKKELRQLTDSLLLPVYPYHETMRSHSNESDLLAIYTRYPILKKELIEYESKGNVSVAFHLLVDSDTVVVVNNHLQSIGYTESDKDAFNQIIKGETNKEVAEVESRKIVDKYQKAMVQRYPQVDSVLNYIDKYAGYSMIVCGDFNDGPISYTRRMLSRNLVDCFVESGTGLGITYHKKRFYVRIDHILCSEDWMPYKCVVDNEIKESDHYPVICWLKKRPNP
ncbi:MAG: endonuclease/exonuclease/phosphatase family protein [Prevotella sp.]|nr:endonuclease/exonuclease/phosphatase family protein [Prevotella sp.]